MKVILVPTDGSPASMRAVTLACSIARRNKGRVYVVHVIEVKRSLPLDADLEPEAGEGERILLQAEKAAHEQDFEVQGELLQAREAGHAVVDEAVERGVDAIILGVDYKRPVGDFQVGRLAQYVLKNAPCVVWICRQPVEERE
jgi:nucleotide-binding universal stress UspA family protein